MIIFIYLREGGQTLKEVLQITLRKTQFNSILTKTLILLIN